MYILFLKPNTAKLQQMTRIAENLKQIQSTLPQQTKLIVVSKYRSTEEIQEVYAAGQRVFAENRVQALLERAESLPKDIEWHLIGHLQSNKVKYIASFIHTIHSVDSAKLLYEINEQAAKHGRMINCLLQVHIAKEDTKFGFETTELMDFLEKGEWANLSNVRITGLMAMATNTDEKEQIHHEFERIQSLFDSIKKQYFSDKPFFRDISTGMSSDYKIAVEHGSTYVRIGSAVFE